MEESTFGTVVDTLQTGLPVLLWQFATTLALLALGIGCYTLITPFHEWRLVRDGNAAAGVVLAGAIVALALQLLTLAAAAVLVRGLRGMIEAGNVAAAFVLVGVQLAVALLNAGAMSG